MKKIITSSIIGLIVIAGTAYANQEKIQVTNQSNDTVTLQGQGYDLVVPAGKQGSLTINEHTTLNFNIGTGEGNWPMYNLGHGALGYSLDPNTGKINQNIAYGSPLIGQQQPVTTATLNGANIGQLRSVGQIGGAHIVASSTSGIDTLNLMIQ